MADTNDTLSSDIGGGLESFERLILSSPIKAMSITSPTLNNSNGDSFEDSLSTLDPDERNVSNELENIEIDNVRLHESSILTSKSNHDAVSSQSADSADSLGVDTVLRDIEDGAGDRVQENHPPSSHSQQETSTKTQISSRNETKTDQLNESKKYSSGGSSILGVLEHKTQTQSTPSTIDSNGSVDDLHSATSNTESAINTYKVDRFAHPTQTTHATDKLPTSKETSVQAAGKKLSSSPPTIRPIRSLLDYDFKIDQKSSNSTSQTKTVGGVRESKRIDFLENQNFQLQLKVYLLEQELNLDPNDHGAESRRQLQDALTRLNQVQKEKESLKEKLLEYASKKSNGQSSNSNYEYDDDDDNDNPYNNNSQSSYYHESLMEANLRYQELHDYTTQLQHDFDELSQRLDDSTSAASFPSDVYRSSGNSTNGHPMTKIVRSLNSENESIRRALAKNEDPYISQSPVHNITGPTFRMLEEILFNLTGNTRTVGQIYETGSDPEDILYQFVCGIADCIDNLLSEREAFEADRQNFEESSLRNAQDLESFLEKNTKMKYVIQDLHEELRKKNSTVDDQAIELRMIKNSSNKLMTELRSVSKERDDLNITASKIVNAIKSKYDENATLHTVVECIEDAFNIISDVDELSTQVDGLSKDLQVKVERIQSLERSKSDLVSDMRLKKMELAKLGDELVMKAHEKDELSVELEGMRLKNEDKDKTISSLEDRIRKLTNDINQIRNEKYRLSTELIEKVEENADLESKWKEATKKLNDINSKANSTQSNYTELLTDITNLRTEKQELEIKLVKSEQEIEHFHRDYENLVKKNKGLEESILFQQSRTDQLEKKLDRGVSGVINGGLQAFKQENYKRAIALQKEVDRLVQEKKVDSDKIKFWETQSQESRGASQRLMQTFFQSIYPILGQEEAERVSMEYDNINKDRSKSRFVSMEQLMSDVLGTVKKKVGEFENALTLNSANSGSGMSGDDIEPPVSSEETKLWKARYLAMKGKFNAEREARYAEYVSYVDRVSQSDEYVRKLEARSGIKEN